MLNGLDLFSGIGGLAIALAPWVQPIAYCEIDRYAQSVLLSHIAQEELPFAPIWEDVRSLSKETLGAGITGEWNGQGLIDIITGGFPCQDISVAGLGAGLEGKRSGLFFEIVRLTRELRPSFIFLENVPAITTRGGIEVVRAFTSMGYDCRWCVISAASLGAPHKRERWFLLAHTNRGNVEAGCERSGPVCAINSAQKTPNNASCRSEIVAHSQSQGFEEALQSRTKETYPRFADSSWWEIEPSVGRVANGIPSQLDRIKCLGNAVVPIQARKAFQILMGLRR